MKSDLHMSRAGTQERLMEKIAKTRRIGWRNCFEWCLDVDVDLHNEYMAIVARHTNCAVK